MSKVFDEKSTIFGDGPLMCHLLIESLIAISHSFSHCCYKQMQALQSFSWIWTSSWWSIFANKTGCQWACSNANSMPFQCWEITWRFCLPWNFFDTFGKITSRTQHYPSVKCHRHHNNNSLQQGILSWHFNLFYL